MPGRGAKPGERRGGRKKGTPNKLTADLKTMIESALMAASGQGYLTKIAVDNPHVFCRLLARLLPRDISLTIPAQPGSDNSMGSLLDVARRLCFVLQAAEAELTDGASAKRARIAKR